MLQQSKPKKSLWFLTIVAFLMIMVGIGYTMSSVFAINNPQRNQQPIPYLISSVNVASEEKENLFSTMEKQVATKATTLRNDLVVYLRGESSPRLPSPKPTTEEKSESSSSISQREKEILATIDLPAPRPYPTVFEDIDHTSAKEAILTLYSQNLIQSTTKKFHPQNYVRISDFIRVVMDTYRLQLWYNPKNLEGLSKNEYFSYTTVPVEVLIRVNSAYELWFLQKLALEDSQGNPRLWEFISPQEAKDMLLAVQKKSPSLLTYPMEMTFISDKTLLKEEMAQLVVSAFWLKLNERSLPVFSDISWTPHRESIQQLAKRWIVSWVSGKFYPDAPVEYKDFVIMVVRSLIAKQGTSIVIDNFYYLKPLINVPTNTSYAPHLEYCLESQVCNPLLAQASGGVTFLPNKLLSKWEAYTVLSNTTSFKFEYPSSWRESMTRGELAELIVTIFDVDQPSSSSSSLNSEKLLSSGQSLRSKFQQLMKIS